MRAPPLPARILVLENTLAAKHNLATVLRAKGEWVEAETLALGVLAARRRVLGDTHPATLASINNLGELRLAQGEAEKAEPLFREAYEGFLATRGEDDPSTKTIKAQWQQSLEALASPEADPLPSRPGRP